ncbi:reverse transcriptase domain-containing protein [Frigoriglobus tundricola]|uniref:Reverse transcriptase domain-containing protein n=1 Tax=Frigoriglobus tundricola TaxID=2774151 RepID=A0A6M5Z3R5_9BACT|nr:reverse transcriptase domain-containing protein [Frigoriglobus tundricola]QJX00407.1 hypothetical protein FTUN_8037 [Frigoriglobus tundricola]
MPTNHTRLLARIKLRETERQRDRLRKQYGDIEAQVAAAGSPLDRLRALHTGLRDVTFAQKALHPAVREIDALYLADGLGVVPPELVVERTRFLEHELAQGRLRAEFTYAFGRVLSEWVSTEAVASPVWTAGEAAIAGMFTDPPMANADWVALLARANAAVFQSVAKKVKEFGTGAALRPVDHQEITTALGHIARHPYLAPALRRQAAEARASGTQITELAGVATILLNSLDEWDWPAEGVPMRGVWVRVKLRPYLDEDLVTAVFLQVIGSRWGSGLHPILRWDALQDGREPLFRREPIDSPTAGLAAERFRAQAERLFAALPSEGGGGALETGYAGVGQMDLLSCVEREVRFARAAFPDRPCYVAQADLRDFYPSLPHALVLDVLGHLGVPEKWLAFFAKFLAARVQWRGQIAPLRRGLALEHPLADVLADAVLWTLDVYMFRTTGLQPIRLVDDIWLIADSHEKARAGLAAIHNFCSATGLAVNEDKSGAVRVGGAGAPLDGLPPGGPRWGLLRLQSSGEWAIDEPALARLEAITRDELAACPSVLALVAQYNGYLGYIIRQLALPVTLLGDHLRRVGQRLQKTHDELFGPGHGLVEEVGRRLRDCFADARLKEQGLPHALIYWPITAGGLALAHPLLHVAAHLRGRVGWAAPKPPNREVVAAYLWRREEDARKRPLSENEQNLLDRLDPLQFHSALSLAQLEEYQKAVKRGDKSLPDPEEVGVAMVPLWANYYRTAIDARAPSGPPQLDAMERLVQDFIARGGEVSGRGQHSLTAYWRWVVYTYGPSLLGALGTFRFLLTELVPLQLILENRGLTAGRDDSADGESAPPVSRNHPAPPAGPNDPIPF